MNWFILPRYFRSSSRPSAFLQFTNLGHKAKTQRFKIRMENSYSSIKALLLGEDYSKVQSSTKPNLTISIEGNIGCGKSTLLEYFAEFKDGLTETMCEPIEKWTDIQGHNALGLLYERPERWAFSFNMYAMLTRVHMHTKNHNKPIKMMERSLHSTRYCFIENSYANNDLTPCEFTIMSQWYDYLVSDEKANVDLIIYLKADPLVCFDRLKKRSRSEEAGVPKSLLESLHKFHEDWLINKKFGVPAPVLVVDANPNITSLKDTYHQLRQEFLEMFSSKMSTH